MADYYELKSELTIKMEDKNVFVEIYKELPKGYINPFWTVQYIDNSGNWGVLMTWKNRPKPSEIKKELEKYY